MLTNQVNPEDNSQPVCQLCGEPMPLGEEMFMYHGYSCECPKPPLAKLEPVFKRGDKVRKIKGYPFRGTVLAVFTKINEDIWFAAVQIQTGENASGLVYFHPVSVLALE